MLKRSGLTCGQNRYGKIVAALFAHPTIERLAAHIEGEDSPALPNGVIAIERNGGTLSYIPVDGGSCFRIILPPAYSPHLDSSTLQILF